MEIGKYSIESLETGKFSLDGGAMFGIIPKVLWERSNPADRENRVALSARSMLLRSRNRNILIDTGMGEKWDEKSYSIYDINQNKSPLVSTLRDKGLSPEDITDVILTHLHFDHTGGSTKYENGKLVPTFPNAKYYVQKKNFDWATAPSDRDKGSYLQENFTPLMHEGILYFTEGNTFFDDEIELLPVNGHTFGQQLVKVSDTTNTVLYCGDLIPFSSHVHLPYIMGYDLQPLVTLEEKKKYLRQAVEENWILFHEHDPFNSCSIVESSGKSYKIKERIKNL